MGELNTSVRRTQPKRAERKRAAEYNGGKGKKNREGIIIKPPGSRVCGEVGVGGTVVHNLLRKCLNSCTRFLRT